MESNIVALVVILALEIISGLFNNLFIISVICFDFYKQKHIINSYKILVSLAISNVMYNILISAGLLEEFIGLRASSTFYLSSMYITLLLCSVGSCAWLTAGLGAFYFIKISQSRLLSWIKFHLNSIVPWMLLVLHVVSFIMSVLSSSLLISPQTSLRNITGSPPFVMMMLAENTSGLINAVLAVTSIPFIVIHISTVCTVWTLRRHSRKVERRMDTVDNGRLTPYERVVCRMTQFFFFYSIIYTLMLIFYFSIIVQLQSAFWITLLLLSSFTPIQSALLIVSNPRLKDVWKEMFHYHVFAGFLCGSNEG